MDNDTKHTAKAPQEFLKAKKWNNLQWPTEHAFHFLKTKLRAGRPINKQQQKVAAVNAQKSISREETQHLVNSMGSRLEALIDYNERAIYENGFYS